MTLHHHHLPLLVVVVVQEPLPVEMRTTPMHRGAGADRMGMLGGVSVLGVLVWCSASATAQVIEIRGEGSVAATEFFYALPAELQDVAIGEPMSLTIRFDLSDLLALGDDQARAETQATLTMQVGGRVTAGEAPIQVSLIRLSSGRGELLWARFLGSTNVTYDKSGALFQEEGDAEVFSLFAGLPAGTLRSPVAPLTAFSLDGPFGTFEEVAGTSVRYPYSLATEALTYAVPAFLGSSLHAVVRGELSHLSLAVIPAPASLAPLLAGLALRRRRSVLA